MWCLEGEISQDNVHWCGPTIGDPFCALESGVGSPGGEKKDRRQTEKKRSEGGRARTITPHRWNAIARLCFIARFAPFFPLTDILFFFVISSFFHFSRILSRQWGSMAVSTKVFPAKRALRLRLRLGAAAWKLAPCAIFAGSRCWSHLAWICRIISCDGLRTRREQHECK